MHVHFIAIVHLHNEASSNPGTRTPCVWPTAALNPVVGTGQNPREAEDCALAEAQECAFEPCTSA